MMNKFIKSFLTLSLILSFNANLASVSNAIELSSKLKADNEDAAWRFVEANLAETKTLAEKLKWRFKNGFIGGFMIIPIHLLMDKLDMFQQCDASICWTIYGILVSIAAESIKNNQSQKKIFEKQLKILLTEDISKFPVTIQEDIVKLREISKFGTNQNEQNKYLAIINEKAAQYLPQTLHENLLKLRKIFESKNQNENQKYYTNLKILNNKIDKYFSRENKKIKTYTCQFLGGLSGFITSALIGISLITAKEKLVENNYV